MERGSSKHSARLDEALDQATAGELGPGGSNREEWAAAEPPADDDPPMRVDPRGPGPADTGGERAAPEGAANQDEAEMRRLRHDMSVANDWNPGVAE